MPSTGVPPLAGLGSYAQAARVGPFVEESVRLLRRLSQVERRTMLVLAAHLNAVPEWAEYERIVEEDHALERSDWWDEFYAAIEAPPRTASPRPAGSNESAAGRAPALAPNGPPAPRRNTGRCCAG